MSHFRFSLEAQPNFLHLEDEYNRVVKAHEATLAVLRKAQVDTKLNALLEQAQRIYENELENIE